MRGGSSSESGSDEPELWSLLIISADLWARERVMRRGGSSTESESDEPSLSSLAISSMDLQACERVIGSGGSSSESESDGSSCSLPDEKAISEVGTGGEGGEVGIGCSNSVSASETSSLLLDGDASGSSLIVVASEDEAADGDAAGSFLIGEAESGVAEPLATLAFFRRALSSCAAQSCVDCSV